MTNEQIISHTAELVAAIKVEVERIQRLRNSAQQLLEELKAIAKLANPDKCRNLDEDLHGKGLVSARAASVLLDLVCERACAAIAVAEGRGR